MRVVHVGESTGTEGENGGRAERLEYTHNEEDGDVRGAGTNNRADDVDGCSEKLGQFRL